MISRELRWWTQIEEARAKAATEAATASRVHAAARAASTEAVLEEVHPEEERPAELLHREPEALTQLWSVRGKIRPVEFAAMLMSLFCWDVIVPVSCSGSSACLCCRVLLQYLVGKCVWVNGSL